MEFSETERQQPWTSQLLAGSPNSQPPIPPIENNLGNFVKKLRGQVQKQEDREAKRTGPANSRAGKVNI